MQILHDYFADAGNVTPGNAWEHVYRCLLWMNEAAGLAHIYDSNHMQPGGVFHTRAVRFTDALCARWQVDRPGLARVIDVLFRGCVAELRKRQEAGAGNGPDAGDAAGPDLLEHAGLEPAADADEDTGIEAELESDLIAQIAAELAAAGLDKSKAGPLAQRIEASARQFFTIGNKRKNALGEGFEDLLVKAAGVPEDRIKTRTPVSKMPGFRKALPKKKGGKPLREPRPDIAIVEGEITHVIATAKWSLRQDRETQLASEYQAFQRNRTQPTELQYFLVTNEFDLARLRNVCAAIPTGEGGYVFHTVYHVCLPLLKEVHGERFNLGGYVENGELASLSDFLADMQERFGA